MTKKIIAVALTPQDLPGALRQAGIEFHQNTRTVKTRPDMVISPILKLEDHSVSNLKKWKEEGTILMDFLTGDQKAPFSDAICSPKWDPSIQIMRYSEALNQFHPHRMGLTSQKKGPLTPHDLADAIREIVRAQVGGVLICKEEHRQHRLYFDRGRLYSVTTNIEGEHLGNFLVSRGKIKPIHFASASRKYFESGLRIGQCLVASGALSETKLREVLMDHMETIGALTFTWCGSWEFYKSPPPVHSDLHFDLNLNRIILEGLNSIKEYEPPSPLPWQETDMVSAQVKNIKVLPLTPDQYYLLEQLGDKTIEVRHLCSLLPPPEKAKDRHLSQLYFSGVVRVAIYDPLDEILDRARAAKKQTYYEILELDPKPEESEIRKKYFEMAKKYHPDRFSKSERFSVVKDTIENYFASINAAYQILSDPNSRKEYDQKLMGGARSAQASPEDKMAELMREVRKSLSQKQYKAAIQKLNEVFYLGGKNADTYRIMGQCLMTDESKLKEAEHHLRQSLALDSSNPDTHFLLGKLYVSAGMLSRAKRQLVEALNLQPAHIEADTLLKEISE